MPKVWEQTIDGKRKPEGTWIKPVRKGFRFVCCDCGNVHAFDFKVINGRVMMSVNGDHRRTAARRRAKKFAGVAGAIKAMKELQARGG